MKNKSYNNLLLNLLIISLLILANSCKKDDVTDPPSTLPNYKISINNLTNFPARQFTYITLTPTEAGGTEQAYEFVCDPNKTIDVNFYISKITFYKVRIYIQKNGQSVWWNSVAFEPNKTSLIQLLNSSGNFLDNSNLNSLKPDGCDIQ